MTWQPTAGPDAVLERGPTLAAGSERRRLRSMALSSQRTLTLALVSTLVVSTATSGAAALAVSRTLERAAEVARREEQTAYLVGETALDVSRTRSELLAALAETGPVGLDDARETTARARKASTAVTPLLGPEEAESWGALEPRLRRTLDIFALATAAIEYDDRATARALMHDADGEVVRLFRQLDAFRDISLADTEYAIGNIETRGLRTLELASLAWAGLVTVLVVVWVLVLRVLSRQRATIATKVRDLEASNRELEAFAGRVAHDMRNVLAPIRLGVAAIEARSEDPLLQRIAEKIERSCTRGRDLVDALLEFSRTGAHGPAAHHDAPLAAELRDVLDQLGERIERADIRISTSIPEEARVAVEPALLHVVLSNIVSNAVKFMRGLPERRLSIEARASAASWLVVASDTGPGIPLEELDRIFDALYRGARARGGGIGLGLATVKRIVESHGGRVDVSSEVGVGTKFCITLPRSSVAPAGAAFTGQPGVRAAFGVGASGTPHPAPTR